MIANEDYLQEYETLYFIPKVTKSDFFRSKDINTYISTQRIHDKNWLYRKVFEKNEIAYLYADFSFFNKKFDEEEWDTEVEFCIYKIVEDYEDPVLINRSTQNINIQSSENIIQVTDSWGADTPGSFWQEGTYRYEVSIDSDLADYHYFYILDNGFKPGVNPYFNIFSLKTFESGAHPDNPENRQFMICFQPEMTRMIWCELEIENRLPGKDWVGEFTFRYYNDAMLLIGSKTVLTTVSTHNKNNSFMVQAGVGHETNVSWTKDKYTIEVWFMGTKVASTLFEVGDKMLRGNTKLELHGVKTKGLPTDVDIDQLPADEKILKDLEGMVGLDSIRKKLRDYISFVKYRQLMEKKGIDNNEPINLHAVFTGNPGTGKTTVAKSLGKVYHQLGLLPRDTVFEADRSTLIGRYIGETAPMTQDVIEKARGGILFIDEAYALSKQGDEKDFGKECLEIILKEMSDGAGDLAIIVAGYPNEMKNFMEFNPGLKSRFQNIYEFPDYTPDELLEIAKRKAKIKNLTIDPRAEPILLQLLSDEFRKRDKTFGNARLVGSIIESAQINLGVRVMKNKNPEKLSVKKISTILAEDIHCISLKKGRKIPVLPIDEKLLSNSLKEINSLMGLERLKTQVFDFVKLVRFYKEMNKNILNSFSLHNVFMGNPGTGKTTVARLMAQIFKALGVLERGHLVECTREDLVAGFVGQTAIKTNKVVDKDLGGVLFIDEAYSLSSPRGNSDYGMEAVEILLKRMEDERGNLAVIMAGYTREMEHFLDTNPGLRSRMDNLIMFDDFSTSELQNILTKMLSDKQLSPTKEALEVVNTYLKTHAENRDRFFGNARFTRKVADKIFRNQLLRLGDMKPDQRTPEIMKTVTLQDVADFTENMDKLQSKPSIGFSLPAK